MATQALCASPHVPHRVSFAKLTVLSNLQALVCGVIGGIGGLIVEVILFIIKGSQLDAAAERARKRGGERRVQRPTRPPKELMAEAEASVAAAAAGTGIDSAPAAPSSESKKEA